MKRQRFTNLLAALFLLGTGTIPTFNHYFISDSLRRYENYRFERVDGNEKGSITEKNQTVTYVYRQNDHDQHYFTEIQQVIADLEKKARIQPVGEHSELGAILSALSGTLLYGMRDIDS